MVSGLVETPPRRKNTLVYLFGLAVEEVFEPEVEILHEVDKS